MGNAMGVFSNAQRLLCIMTGTNEILKRLPILSVPRWVSFAMNSNHMNADTPGGTCTFCSVMSCIIRCLWR